MNFLFINSARNWGGNENWVYMTTRKLAEHHNVFLAYRDEAVGDRFDICKLRLPFLSEIDIYTIFELLKIIRRQKIDVVIPSKQKEYFLAGIAASISGVKNIIRLGIVRDLKNKWINNIVYNKLCDGIIVNARIIKEVLMKSRYIQENKIKVIYNGIDESDIVEKAQKSTDCIIPFRFLIGAMGELSKRKGFDLLLSGFGRFIKETKLSNSCGLIIIGEGEERNNLEKKCEELKIAQNVFFPGFKSNPFPILYSCDLFVLTSENEGLSNALLESMILKKPVVTSRAGGVDEIIRHGQNGYLLNNFSVNELSDLFKKIYFNKSERNKIALEGWKTVKEQFSLERMTDEFVTFCKKVTNRD